MSSLVGPYEPCWLRYVDDGDIDGLLLKCESFQGELILYGGGSYNVVTRAIYMNNPVMVGVLLKRGVVCNNAMNVAIQLGRRRCIQVLLDHGVKLDSLDALCRAKLDTKQMEVIKTWISQNLMCTRCRTRVCGCGTVTLPVDDHGYTDYRAQLASCALARKSLERIFRVHRRGLVQVSTPLPPHKQKS